MAELRPNKAKHKLLEGEIATVVSGHMNAEMIEFLGPLGFDAMWIETEHGPIDFADIPNLTRACDLWGMTSMVRVNLNLPGVIYRTLDVGAQGIVVPHVDTGDEARAVVDAAKFAPIGARGGYTGRQGFGVADYINKANDETMVVVLIEDVRAVENLDEILTVDHIDVFFVATGDLALSMDLPGQRDHPDVLAIADRTTERILEAGRVAGTVVSDATVESYISKGVRFLMTSWTAWAETGARAYLDRIAGASR